MLHWTIEIVTISKIYENYKKTYIVSASKCILIPRLQDMFDFSGVLDFTVTDQHSQTCIDFLTIKDWSLNIVKRLYNETEVSRLMGFDFIIEP